MNSEIEILSEMEAVRQNPGMYIGSVDQDGTHHLLYEVIHNAVDEARLGHAKRVEVHVGPDFCEVRDDGRGIPTEIHPQAGVPACEVALTRLHSGSKFRRSGSFFTAGLHGVGIACVNALSTQLQVTIERDGRKHEQCFERGRPSSPLRDLGPSSGHGTTVRFQPDLSIFSVPQAFNADRCRDFIEDLSHLNPEIEFRLRVGSEERAAIFHSPANGLFQLLKKHSRGSRALFAEPIHVQAKSEGMTFEALFYWTAETEPVLASFVNNIRTVQGGTHVNALRAGLVRALSRWVDAAAEVNEVTEGLAAVINVQLSLPRFEGQTKSRLTNHEIAAVIEQATADGTEAFLSKNPHIAAIITDRIKEARHARLAARRVAEKVYFQFGRQNIEEEVYKEQFGARSKNWHDSAAWITHQELLQSHADLCAVGPDAVALDVCCGSGVVGASFKSKVKKVIGLDLTPEMVRLAKDRLDEVVQGNVYNIPFADNTFDLVCTREVLHLLPDPERPVSEIFRVLKPGGQFVVGQILPFNEHDAAWLYRIFKKKQPLFFNLFQEADFRRLLLSPGFVDIQMTEMTVWESIDTWIDSFETTAQHRHEIRHLYRTAPPEVKAVHPFKIDSAGRIQDLWRWCVFSLRKPL